MKTKTLATMAREAEVEREVSATASPKISLKKALAARFIWQKQEYTVGECDLQILRAFLAYHGAPLLLAKRRNQYENALSCLDEEYGAVGRWQSVDSLLFYGALLPLR